MAEDQGLEVAPEWKMRRWLEATVSAPIQVLSRKGVEALKRLYPPQVRDKTALCAMEAVNADFHKFDVFVRWPASPGQNEPEWIGRPQMVGFQDIYSGQILSWRVDQSPNSTAVMLAAGDMIEEWGIPKHVLFDNGREFAAKNVTGGAPTRFRFKVKEDDIPGLFTMLGCQIHWATPYAGQSKPVERAWRDFASSIAKDPRFAGAYTGNKVDAKPENYGEKAIDLDVFQAVLAEGIAEHNTRLNRRSEVAFGRSFAEVFAESYATAPISKATEAQRRFWLLGAEGLRAKTGSGELAFMDNVYWADWMHEIAGARVVVRFDPADLHSGVHVFSQDNAYLGHAPAHQKVGFFAIEEARSHARARKAWMKAQKKALEAHRRFKVTEIAAGLDQIAPALGRLSDSVRPEAKVALFGLKTAERMVPAFLGPTGAKWPLQASLGSAIAAWFSPPGNVAGVGNVVELISPTATGTLTARNVATTNLFTRRHRAGYVSAATAAALAGLRFPAASYQTGDGAAGSGFFLAFEFGASDAATVAGARMFAGMSASVAAPTNVEPSTLVNCIGVGHGAADTNLKLFFGGSTAQTPIDLGVNFPVNTLSVDWYRVVLYAPSSLTGTVYYEITRMNTGHAATGTLSGAAAVLPAATVLLNAMNSYRTNNATALAVGLDHGIIYAEQGT